MGALGVADDQIGTIALVAAICAVMTFVLLIGAVVSARQGSNFSRRLERVQQRGRGAASTKGPLAIRRGDSGGPLSRALGRWVPRRAVLEARLGRTGRKLTVTHYVITAFLIGAAQSLACAFAFRFSPGLSLLLGVAVGFMVPHIAVGYLGNRRLKAFIALFPEGIDLIVRGLRSGLPISESIGTVGRELADPVGTEFRLIDQSVKLGRSLEDAMWDAAQRIDVPEFKFFIISLSVQRETGGNLAETLDNLSDILRKRRQMKLKVKALSSEARASAYIIGSLPFVMFGILLLVNGPYVLELFSDPRGLVMVGVGLFSMLIGVLVMAKMVRFEI